MTNTRLRTLVNNSLRTNPNDKDSLADAMHAAQFLQPADVRLSGKGGWKGDPDFLVALAMKNPKRLPQLIGVRSIHPSMVDSLLGVDHKPTAQIAERVAAHQEVTRTGIDYIVANGTYPALNRLIECHFDNLTFEDLKVASERSAKVSGRLLSLDMSLVGEWPSYHYFPTPLRRDFLSFQLDALTALDPTKVDTEDAKPLVNSATQAGLALTAAQEQHLTLPVDISVLRHTRAWAVRDPDELAKSMLLLNPEFGDMLRSLPVESQASVVHNYPRWSVLAQCSDVQGVLQHYPKMWTTPGESGPTDSVVLCMPMDMITADEQLAATALHLVRERVGDDPNSWADFAGLAETWDGSLGELLDTLVAI